MEYQTLFCTGKDIDTLWKIKIKELVGILVVMDHYVPSCGNYVMVSVGAKKQLISWYFVKGSS